MERGYEISVLDHGYVRLVDWMGSDEAIVEAARMSTGRGFVSWESYGRCKGCNQTAPLVRTEFQHDAECIKRGGGFETFPRGDLGLLDTMYRNHHATPFEFGELHVEVQAPIMVYREWHRHRTQSYSEFSARYSQMPDLHYVPAPERIQKQNATNRQGSGEAFDAEYAGRVVNEIGAEQREVYARYEALIEDGVAKEVARVNTPVSRYSKMRAKTDLRNWLAFLLLRTAPAAQWEIRQYALAVAEIVRALWPRTYALFEEYDLRGVHLSRTEARRLAEFFAAQGTVSGADFGGDERAGMALLLKLGFAPGKAT